MSTGFRYIPRAFDSRPQVYRLACASVGLLVTRGFTLRNRKHAAANSNCVRARLVIRERDAYRFISRSLLRRRSGWLSPEAMTATRNLLPREQLANFSRKALLEPLGPWRNNSKRKIEHRWCFFHSRCVCSRCRYSKVRFRFDGRYRGKSYLLDLIDLEVDSKLGK